MQITTHNDIGTLGFFMDVPQLFFTFQSANPPAAKCANKGEFCRVNYLQ